jgi:hypothetical protein
MLKTINVNELRSLSKQGQTKKKFIKHVSLGLLTLHAKQSKLLYL